MQILVLNCGSSSLKWAVLNPAQEGVTASGVVESLGNGKEIIFGAKRGDVKLEENRAPGGHLEALTQVVELLEIWGLKNEIQGIGHRMVHGAEVFSESVLIDDEVLAQVEKCVPLAPLHNPANLLGVKVARELFPSLPQVGVFDTAFHQTLPAKAYMYALPYELYKENGVRRYGFHGSSHRFVATAAAKALGQNPSELGLVILHLGNGCSASAIYAGKSLDTTMGLTPLEGLTMGTRCGDVDAGITPFLAQELGLDLAQINDLYNKKSGLLGLSGITNDMRSLKAAEAEGSERAKLARDVFCYRAAKAVGSLAVALPKLDAIVFTGGIGENAADIRQRIMAELKVFGIKAHPQWSEERSGGPGGQIQSEDSPIKVLVVSTDEERMIAMDTVDLISK